MWTVYRVFPVSEQACLGAVGRGMTFCDAVVLAQRLRDAQPGNLYVCLADCELTHEPAFMQEEA